MGDVIIPLVDLGDDYAEGHDGDCSNKGGHDVYDGDRIDEDDDGYVCGTSLMKSSSPPARPRTLACPHQSNPTPPD